MRRRYHRRVKGLHQHHSLSVDISLYSYDKARFLVAFAYRGAAVQGGTEEVADEEECEDVGELQQVEGDNEDEIPELGVFENLDNVEEGEVSDSEGLHVSQVSVQGESVDRQKRKCSTEVVPTQTKKEVAQVVMNRIAFIKGEMQLPVTRLHSDRGNEFLNAKMKQFVAEQGIRQTVTTGGSGKQNGRAESSIGRATGLIRTLLHSGGVEKSYWSAAARTADYLLSRRQAQDLKQLIPKNTAFGDRVIVKLYATSSEVKDQLGQKLIRIGKSISTYEGQCVPGGAVVTDKGEVVKIDTIRRIGKD